MAVSALLILPITIFFLASKVDREFIPELCHLSSAIVDFKIISLKWKDVYVRHELKGAESMC